MRKILNQLIQLQELHFALDEHRLSLKNGRTEDLETDISALIQKLPSETAALFGKLQRRDPPAVAPVIEGTCYGCGIDLPISLTSEILHFDTIYQCPSCARFLYPYSGEKIGLEPGFLSKQLPRLGIDKYSSERLMIPDLSGEDPEAVIAELAAAVAEEVGFPNPDLLAGKALEREAIIATALDHGLAFPHVRGFDGGCLTLAVGLKKKGIKFGAPAGRLTRVFFFAVIPLASSAFYLKLLAGLAEAFREKERRDELMDCPDAKTLWKTLKKNTRKFIT